MKKTNSHRILEKQKAVNREWLVKPGTERMKADDLREIEEDIQSGSPVAPRHIANSLGRLSTWHAVAGQVALLDGSADGWREIHRSWLYRSIALRLRISEFQKGRVLGQFRPIKDLEGEASLCVTFMTESRSVWKTMVRT